MVPPDGKHQQTIRLGRCSEAGQVAGDASGGSVLVTGSLDCNPSSASARDTGQLWDYSSSRLRLVGAPPQFAHTPAEIAW